MASSDPKEKIEHVAVLMLENRSFDHMLGHLSLPEEDGGIGWKDLDGILDPRDHSNPNSESGEEVSLQRLTDTARVKVDTPHMPDQVKRQIQAPEGGMMQGFVDEYRKKLEKDGEDLGEAPLALSYYARPEVWALSQLAEQFAVCDKWFSPIPGPTQPNRMFALAGHSNGHHGNQFPWEGGRWNIDPVFEKFPEARVSWRSYSHDMSFLRMVDDYLWSQHIEKITGFYRRARDRRLPHVSWIDPNFRSMPEIIEDSQELAQWTENVFEGIFGEQESHNVDLETDNSDHPDADIAEGQKLIARVYNALLQNDPTLEKTLFIITYDEHGGFYDHVIPPGWPDAEQNLGDGSSKLGPRVPSLAISGHLQGGQVCSKPMDHSTIVRTLLERFAPDELKNSPERVQKVPSLWDALDWRDEAPQEAFAPLRKPRPRKNGLRDEMGNLAREALEKGTPVDRL